jgi:hypothetical protein
MKELRSVFSVYAQKRKKYKKFAEIETSCAQTLKTGPLKRCILR